MIAFLTALGASAGAHGLFLTGGAIGGAVSEFWGIPFLTKAHRLRKARRLARRLRRQRGEDLTAEDEAVVQRTVNG